MVLNGAGGWENRKTLATDAKMREEGEEKGRKRKGKRRKGRGKEGGGGKKTHRRYTAFATCEKSPNHRHMRRTTKPPPQNPSEPPSRPNNSRENQPKSRRPILATSRKLIIIFEFNNRLRVEKVSAVSSMSVARTIKLEVAHRHSRIFDSHPEGINGSGGRTVCRSGTALLISILLVLSLLRIRRPCLPQHLSLRWPSVLQ
jgi:hypothetical protein